jgi:carboxymethylenebutenolidase
VSRLVAVLFTAAVLVAIATDGGGQPAATRSSADAQWMDVATADGHTLVAAVARPIGAGPFPVVVILHGAEGFRPHYVDLARALADANFIGVAAAWFAGSRGPGSQAGFSDVIACPRCPSIDDTPQLAVPRIAALVDTVRKMPGAQAGRVGLFGQSRGAAAALLTASSGTAVQAVVLSGAGYGGGPRGGRSMMDTAPALTAPLLILHSTTDEIMPVDDARAYEQALRKLGKPVEARYFQGAVHQMPFRPETQAAVREAMITFFRVRLGGAG